MKNFYFRISTALVFLFVFKTSHAQVNLPYTLNFNFNDAGNWSDGIAQDGDGGTGNINGITIQIYATDAAFTKLPGSTLEWYDNSSYYGSGTPGYTAITPGPSATVSMNGVGGMVLKSSSAATNFALKSIQLYDWGGTSPVRIAAYDNGSLIGFTDVSFDQVNWTTTTVTLNQTSFGNIDEVRCSPSPSSGNSVFWLSMNNISLGTSTGTLPVKLSYFEGKIQSSNSIALQWQTENEQNSDHFEIEKSLSGNEFVKIGEVKAKRNSTTNSNYQFACNSNTEIKNFFRLKQVDADGSFSYSKVISIGENKVNKIQIAPNPAKNVVTIVSPDNVRQARLFNSSGVLLRTIIANTGSITIGLSNVPKGVYYLQIEKTQNETERYVLLKD